jgi:hypothetical protein
MGYAARQWEEGFDHVESSVPSILAELRSRLAGGQAVADTIADVSLELSETERGDPQAPRSIDAIAGTMLRRDDVARMCVRALIAIGAERAREGGVDVPTGLNPDSALRAWRIGFLVRCCESSLPADIELREPKGSFRFVDQRAVDEALCNWLMENPEATEEDALQARESMLANPAFWVDPEGEHANEAMGERYLLVEFDAAGNIVARYGSNIVPPGE